MTSKLEQMSGTQKKYFGGALDKWRRANQMGWGGRLLSYAVPILIVQCVEDAGDIGFAF
jgi:hypothetical protein